ncbi:MAG TPA: nucleotidyltransferase family protein [Cytophagaceae bacterium]|jgi:dTDP-glucose pyrophosphorylase|nr:nucleotidyltransferase family protein [Cytophagaceae bacterium]
MKDFLNNIIYESQTIREALAKLDEYALKINLTLFVLDEEHKMSGTVTDGDIRRGLLSGISIDDKVTKVMYSNFRYLEKGQNNVEKIAEYRAKGIQQLPVLDKDKKIHNIFSFREKITLLPVEVVLMAGGIGERLKPLTDHLPKPLLPVGNKPIIEHNIDRLIRFGVEHIKISIRYMGEKIEHYFGDGKNKNITISYLKEDKPMGTIGSLCLVDHFEHDTVIVMNSDLLTNINFEEFYLQFKNDRAVMSVATIPYKINVPYAIMEVNENEITSLKEKPTYTYYANAGIYIMSKEALSYIPDNTRFDAPDLLEVLINNGKKVTSYPILEYWLDIGKPEDYKKAQEDIKHINLYN